jgi:Domain of unknown function (DUF6532)
MLTGYLFCHQIECCINEWTSGTRKESLWDEERFRTVYRTHRKSLTEPSEMLLGGDELKEIRRAFWETALYSFLCIYTIFCCSNIFVTSRQTGAPSTTMGIGSFLGVPGAAH